MPCLNLNLVSKSDVVSKPDAVSKFKFGVMSKFKFGVSKFSVKMWNLLSKCDTAEFKFGVVSKL